MTTPAEIYQGNDNEIPAVPVTPVRPNGSSTKTTVTVTRLPPATPSTTIQNINIHGQLYGTSKWITPATAGLVAEAEFEERSCCPKCCSRMYCACTSKEIYRRTYARVYENRIEINAPWTYLSLCCLCVCSNKQCLSDRVFIYYFDMPPTTAWSAPFPCCFMTNTCCGRPAVAVFNPTDCCSCCCCAGQTVFASPCKIKCCLCCGDSCYPCATPLLYSVRDGGRFLAAWRAAYESYADKRGIPKAERARFWSTRKGCCGLASMDIQDGWNTRQVKNLVEMQLMDRS